MPVPLTVALNGGLGNQLFQQAAGMVLSGRTGRPVVYSPKWLSDPESTAPTAARHLQLPLTASELDRRPLPSLRVMRLASQLGLRRAKWVVERSADDDALSRVTDRTHIVVGYFQRESYAAEAWSQMLPLFASKGLSSLNLSTRSFDGIVVHMRLGDYVSNSSAARVHGALPPSYYLAAIEWLVSKGLKPHVLLVSDEPEIALDRLRGVGIPPDLRISLGPRADVWGDLEAIAGGSAVVMSNSSFSWWGAYLAYRHSAAKVVYPIPWFAGYPGMRVPLFPEGWFGRLVRP